MKKQKAFTTLLGLGILFIAMAIMSGCGKKGDDYSMGIDGYVYVAKQMTTSGEARNFKIKNGYLYWSVDTEYGLDIRRTPIESGFGGEGVLEVPTGISVFSKDTPFASSGCYEVDEEGNLYYVSKSNMLIKQGADGTECYRISVGDGEEKIGSLMAGTQGRLFTATDEYIYVLDARGRIVDEISVGEYTNLNWSGLQEYYSQGTLLKGDDGSMFFLVGSRQCWEIVEENAGGAA